MGKMRERLIPFFNRIRKEISEPDKVPETDIKTDFQNANLKKDEILILENAEKYNEKVFEDAVIIPRKEESGLIKKLKNKKEEISMNDINSKNNTKSVEKVIESEQSKERDEI